MAITIERLKQLLGEMLIGQTELADALKESQALNAQLAKQLAELTDAKKEESPAS